MTLKEFAKRAGLNIGLTNDRLLYVVIDQCDEWRPFLWQLEDYRVSSVVGVTVYLSPRHEPYGV